MDDRPSSVSSDILRSRGERTPERLALIDADDDRSWTYAEFDAFVDRVVVTLLDAGIGRDGTVATLLDSRPLTAALPFAMMRLGVTLAPLNVALDRRTIDDQIGRIEPDVVLCSADTSATATACFDGTICTVGGETGPAIGRFDPSAFSPGEDALTRDIRDETQVARDETALVVFTSGTTGRPRGVRLTRGNLLASAVASAQRLGVTPHDRWLSPLSTYHVGGIAPYVRSTLYGTTAVLLREFDARGTASVLDDYAITAVSLVPTMLRRLLDVGWRPGPDLRFVLLGGGPASDELLERCLDLGVPVCPTYGATETASQVATATPGECVEHAGTVGRPLAGTSVTVVDGGAPCEPGTAGELVVEGPTVAPGYLDSSATAEAFDDGAFHTGDLGYRDADGRLWIVGRADDAIVTGGENVQPSVVVAAAETHPAVVEAAVVGVPDEEWGEQVVALVVTEGDPSIVLSPDELREWLRGRIPGFAVPKAIQLADSLPRTPSGTIDRGAVRERFRRERS